MESKALSLRKACSRLAMPRKEGRGPERRFPWRLRPLSAMRLEKEAGSSHDDVEMLEVEVVDPAGLVAGDVQPQAGVGVVGPAEHVGVGQGLAEVPQHGEVGGVRGRGCRHRGEDGEEEAHDSRGVHLCIYSFPFPSAAPLMEEGKERSPLSFFPSTGGAPALLTLVSLLLLPCSL
jgi:hypothetical protein